MNMTLLFPALAMGFLGSPHCMGMCGGIVAAFGISMKELSPAKQSLLMATYHIGRLMSYMTLGVIATLFGKQVLAPFLTDNILPRIVLGVAIVFAALLMLGLPILNRLEKIGLGFWNSLSGIRKKVLPINTLPKALAAGMLWGFLPCGLVYGALIMAVSIAASSQTQGLGVLFMLAFGIGTLPMLLLTGTTLTWLQRKVKAFNLRQFSGGIMLISGIFVTLSPIAMNYLHGGHHGHHTHADGSPHIHDHEHMQHSHTQHDHANMHHTH